MPLLVAVVFALSLGQTPDPCATAIACRTDALAAADRGDTEAFHDLMWRAVQKGRPNDPDLMYQLARAQALSGRPDDALVMLGRLADRGVKTDAATNDDFVRVRALKAWPALAARLADVAGAAAASPAPVNAASSGAAGKVSTPAAPAPGDSPSAPSGSAPDTDARPSSPATTAPRVKKPASAASAGLPVAAEGAPVPVAGDTKEPVGSAGVPFAPAFGPATLAYDAVSRRFVLADRAGGRLIVVDETSHHQSTLVSAASAGFEAEVMGFAIDTRRGDLWVISAAGDGAAATASLHKLQLVSGRALSEIKASGPARFCGVAVTPDGTVYVLEADERRVLRLRPGAHALEEAVNLSASASVVSLAAADDRTLFVSTGDGLGRIDSATSRMTAVKGDGLGSANLVGMRNGALFAMQQAEAGSALVRLTFDSSGTRIVRREMLMPSIRGAVAALARDGVYYVAAPGVIRRVPLPR